MINERKDKTLSENKIKEAIKTMEHWIEYEKNNKEKINKADELINIQETILLEYKRVLKENKTLKTFMKDLFGDEDIIENDYVLKDDIKKAMKKYEWATKSYNCDEADYKQSQNIGAWFALLNLINKKGE